MALSLCGLQVTAQKNKFATEKFKYRNSAQFEAFGPAVAYSFNYERNVVNLPRIKTSLQVGAAYIPPPTGLITLHFPINIIQLYSFHQHHIESGLGFILTFSDTDNGATPLRDYDYEAFMSFRLGYRYQKPESHWQFKVLFTPILELEGYRDFLPWGGMTIGYNF